MPTKKQRRFLKRGIYEQQWAMPSCPRSGWCLHYTKPLKSETFRRNIKIFLKNIKKLCDGLEITLGEFFSTDDFDNSEQEIR